MAKSKMPVLTQKWVAALRSGNYGQTQGCLKNDEGFCCLGVAADVMAPKAWLKTKNEDGEYRFRNGSTSSFLDNDDFLRLIPSGKVKVKNPNFNPDLDEEQYYNEKFYELEITQDDMSELNDNHNLNFSQIADIIETWWSKNPIDPSDYHAVKDYLKTKKKSESAA